MKRPQNIEFLIQNLSQGIVYQDVSGAILEANDAAQDILGLSLDQMQGRTSVDPRWRAINKDNDPFPGEDHPSMVSLKTAMPQKNVIMGVYHPIGEKWVWISIDAIPIFEDGSDQPIGVYSVFNDITEKRIAERELLLSNKELLEKSRSLEALFNNQSTYILKTDLNGYVTYANPAYLEMFIADKKNKDAVIGSFGMDQILPYHHDRVREAVAKCLSDPGTPFRVELDKPSADGSVKSSIWDFLALFGDQGDPNEILCTGIDVTAKKTAEILLKASEDNYKNLFNESPQAYLVIQDGIFVECNKASEALIKMSRNQLLGKQPHEISPEYQPNGRLSTELETEYISVVLRDGKFKFEWQHLNGEGNTFLAEINLFKAKYNGQDSILVHWRDITQEKSNLRRIQQLSQIVSQSPVSVIMTDEEGSIQYVNKSTVVSLGYAEEELIGQNPRLWRSGKTTAEEYKLLKNTLRTGKMWKGEFLNVRKDGTTLYESSTIFPIFDDSGGITNFVAIQEDISERKKAETKLRLFLNVFEHAHSGRLVTDMDGVILYCNKFFADSQGYSKDELLGTNYIAQISAESMVNFGILQKRLFKNFTITAMEMQLQRRDGSKFPALINASVINGHEGTDQYISITILDITDRKVIENEIIELNLNLEENVKGRTRELENAIARLETFFSVSIDMMCITDHSGRFMKVSQAFEDVLHFTREELEGQEFMNYVHPDDIENTTSAMQALREHNRVIQFVNRFRTKHGNYRFIEWYASPVGENIYAVARDISERKAREDELIAARKSAEEANASKSMFLSRMSHELRTPMNSILGFAQLLEMSELDEMQETSVQHILSSGKHLLGLINEVLDIARIETGKISLSMEQVNITASIKEVCALLQPLADKNSVEIIRTDSMNEELYVHGDQQRTIQILTNIINNAIKYNRNGGKVTIDQSFVVNKKGVEMIHISVKDTGRGIKEEDLGRLFTPFERLGDQNADIEGTGLGLAVVKELVAVLGGELGVNSTIHEGSEFWVNLPKCTHEDAHSEAEIANELITVSKDGKFATILYVEDNAMNTSLVDDIFKVKRPGYNMVTTIFGSEAVELASAHRPRLILLDLDLPDIHGSVVLQQLKENESTRDMPVVVVSADATKEQITKLMAGGAEHYLTKPFDIKEFLMIVDKYVQN
ncbi:MAG: PAS domain S-box protein [Flavobacteriia bacterium]